MAERKFDYNAIGSAYKSMNSDFEIISQLLTQIDNDYKATVNTGADEDALYGDLGSQLLLDWENVSSNFPSKIILNKQVIILFIISLFLFLSSSSGLKE